MSGPNARKRKASKRVPVQVLQPAAPADTAILPVPMSASSSATSRVIMGRED